MTVIARARQSPEDGLTIGFPDAISVMTKARQSILIVEDDRPTRELISRYLTEHAFAVDAVTNGREMDRYLAQNRVDLIVLDLMLPGEDGLSICRRLRAHSNLPILMLTAKSDEVDRVVGLEMGADDYLVKPFGPRELLARVRALLRRGAATPPLTRERRFSFGGFVIDLDARELVDHSNAPVALTAAEFDLLACFIQHPRRVLTREQILSWTRGRMADPFDRTVDMQISRLRRKLDAASPSTKLITTVRNGGYLFTAHVGNVA